jgi:DNA repair protein RadC
VRNGIKQWPRPERPRERLRASGSAALSTRELLALLIGSGTETRDATEVAAVLLSEASGSLRKLSIASPAELERVQGVGPAVSARLCAALELGRRLAREGPAERTRIIDGRDVFERCAPTLRDLTQEEFRVLLLNTQSAVIHETVITRGTLDGSLVHPREVFRLAIAHNAASVVLVHNHPSGDPTPSPDDLLMTEQLAAAGRILGIAVADHVIIGDACYISFVESGLMARA